MCIVFCCLSVVTYVMSSVSEGKKKKFTLNTAYSPPIMSALAVSLQKFVWLGCVTGRC